MKKEQEIIKTIHAYKEQGYSYQKIADLLNERQIKTKRAAGKWYPKVVRQILLRASCLGLSNLQCTATVCVKN